jgi:hypothetical protein
MNTRTRSNGAAAAPSVNYHYQPAAGEARIAQAPAPAPADSPIVGELQGMSGQIERLQQAISALYRRLEPVSMRPPADSTEGSSPAFGGSPLVHQLAQRRDSIASAASRLEAIAAQLEL